MEVVVDYLGAVKFDVKARKHTIPCDQPEENGGLDEGVTPPELLLASVGTCAGYYAVQYLKTRHLNGRGLSIRVTAEVAKQPARLSSFQIEVHVPVQLNERHREGLLRAVVSCLITNTLVNSPKIDVDIVASAASELKSA